jgi:DNA-binding MarR family transcriptional regulator
MAEHSGRFAVTPARAVEDRRLGDAAYRVLACLGTYAGKDGWCWPSTSTLAERLGVSRQAVQRSLRRLAAFGYIEVEHRRRADGSQDRNRYRLLFDRALFEVRNGAGTVNKEVQHVPEPRPQRDVAGEQPDVAEGQRGRQGDRNVGDTPYIDERTHQNDTLAKANAGSSPAALRTRLYDAGKTILGGESGGLVTKLLKHCAGDCHRALDLLQLCGAKSDPREYLNAILRGDATTRADDVLAETDRLYREIGVSA